MSSIISASIEFPDTSIDEVFTALAHPIRRRIMEILILKPKEVRELHQLFDISKPALVKHLNLLEKASIIRRVKSKKKVTCYPRSETLSALKQYLEFYEMFL